MKAIFATLMLAALALAGCADGPDEVQQSPPVDEAPEEPGFDLSGHETFCDSQSACDFWDDMYHEYVVYDLDTVTIDAIIVPPESPDPLVHTEAIRQAVVNWGEGVKALGMPWFVENFTLNTYVAGLDIIPPAALADPEIVVLTGGFTTTLVGIGLEPKQIACAITGNDATRTYEPHVHDGWELYAADCTGVGFTCFAINVSGAPGQERDVYDLVAHEVGHCLGVGHVGDALDFRAKYAPVEDIMSYQSNPDQVHCVSNLNVRVMEGVYAHLLDRPMDEFLPAGSYYAMAPADYEQVECENPPSS